MLRLMVTREGREIEDRTSTEVIAGKIFRK